MFRVRRVLGVCRAPWVRWPYLTLQRQIKAKKERPRKEAQPTGAANRWSFYTGKGGGSRAYCQERCQKNKGILCGIHRFTFLHFFNYLSTYSFRKLLAAERDQLDQLVCLLLFCLFVVYTCLELKGLMESTPSTSASKRRNLSSSVKVS